MDGDPEQVLDPADIQTLEELARRFTTLAGPRTRASLTKAAAALPARDSRQLTLPKSTLSDLLGGKSMPSRDTVVTFLTVCGLSTGQDQQPWLAAWERVSNAHLRRPADAVRVRDARARLLGVHAAIRADLAQPGPGSSAGAGPAIANGIEDELPVYVPRDLDVDLRTKLTMARERGGFVLLTGDSSVGKTRALFQTLREVVPEWWLLHPSDGTAVGEFAAAPTDRTVVWLDELQNYLDHPGGLPAATIARLVSAKCVVVATLWPDEYATRATRAAPRIAGEPDRHANDRLLLRLADIVTVPGTFSSAERRRAEELAHTDRRIRIALDTPDAGVTQVMAAGPHLIRHWEHAPAEQCYGKAVITAALDARRVGTRAPVTRAYLDAAAPAYLTDAQQATAPTDWLGQGLVYATCPLHGATAALTPFAAGMGRIAGYQVADYLHQHALRVRRTTHLPNTAWHALVNHHHPDDTLHLARNAERRGRDPEAETLYRQAADAGDLEAARHLADLLIEQGHVEELTMRANAGDIYAAHRLDQRLVKQERLEELTTRADTGDLIAAACRANLLAAQGHLEELTRYADTDDVYAAVALAQLLVKQERVEELVTRADAGDSIAAAQLVLLPDKQRWVEELAPRTNTSAQVGIPWSDQDRVEEAIELLRRHSDFPSDLSDLARPAQMLAALLAKQGRIEELTAQADVGDFAARLHLLSVLVKQRQVEQFNARAEAGDTLAADLRAILLGTQEGLEELTNYANAGDKNAAAWLAMKLTEDDLRLRAQAGDPFAAQRLAELMAQEGNTKEAIALLRPVAGTGNKSAGAKMVKLMATLGWIDDLDGEVAAGTQGAVEALRDAQKQSSR